MQGNAIDFSTLQVPGLTWVQSYQGVVRNQGLRQWPTGQSVLVLGQWKPDADEHGKELLGVFGVMEDLRGEFMHRFLVEVETSIPQQRPVIVARFAKSCFVGLKGIDVPLVDKLGRGQAVSGLKRDDIGPVQAALDSMLPAPSLLGVAQAMTSIARAPGLRLYKREAWNDCIKALETCESGEVVLAAEALGRIRDGLRHSGRRPANRVMSRTVLVKGLEYDHVVIGNADKIADCRNLYVALTRARHSVTVISSTSVVWLPEVKK
ncbi:ATP-binding domain-containing protein [Pseudonocardia sp. GCM10023141]|uniref:ATP-binding domain-containing protein n=1 Tax=Pseudonocardia sp. GCM10023141 TaxID=3252653 RepID=UPI00361C38E5